MARGREQRHGERDEEEVGAREKSDAVKHSAVRVIRLRKSAGSTLLHFTGLPFYQFRGYIFMRERDRKRLTFAPCLARMNFRKTAYESTHENSTLHLQYYIHNNLNL